MKNISLVILTILTLTSEVHAYKPPCQDVRSYTGWYTPCVCWGLKLSKNSRVEPSEINPCVFRFKKPPTPKKTVKPTPAKNIYF